MTYPKSGLAATVLCLAALLALPTTLPAQITFERTYGGPNSDAGGSVLQTADGGYLVAGTTWSYGAAGRTCTSSRPTASGDTMWTRTYGGDRTTTAASVQQTTDGGYIIAGYTLVSAAAMKTFTSSRPTPWRHAVDSNVRRCISRRRRVGAADH